MRLEKEFIKAIQKASTPKTSAYDTSATVTRIEGSMAWVHIDGGADETPVERTIDCAVGDTVRIRLSGGAGYVIGNNTAPPTDDAVAIIARDTAYGADKKAQIARQAAQDAIDKAVIAGEAAASAQASATAAGQAASAAQNSADAAAQAASVADGKAVAAGQSAAAAQSSANAAQASADNASEYASRALGNLTTVQSVAETLTWITQHGTMTLTTDTALDPTHVYFVVDANGDYVVGSTHYSIVTEPDAADIGTYYELSIDESLNNYVATHLALTSEGLWLIPDNSGFKVLISVGAQGSAYAAGTHIVASNGNIVATFGTETVIKTTDGTELAHFGYGDTYSGTSIITAPYYTLGKRLQVDTVGEYSLAEGYNTEALQPCDHAEGYFSLADGGNSHVEGNQCVAGAYCTHVQGRENRAFYNYQFVTGKFNQNKSDTLIEVGNGTAANARSNAFEVYNTGKFGTPGMYFSVNSNGEMCVTYEDGT